MVHAMKEMIIRLPDETYERLVTKAASVQKSPEQWILDRLFGDPRLLATTAEPHMLLAAAFDALGFQRLEREKAERLSKLLEVRKARPLSHDETDELHALMTEADALELKGLQHLAAALKP